MKKSSICEVNGKMFRYNFDSNVVEYIAKADKSMIEDNVEWMQKHKEPLWEIDEDGYYFIDRIGLRLENWKNKETRMEYLEEWANELNYEAELMAQDFVKYEMKGGN